MKLSQKLWLVVMARYPVFLSPYNFKQTKSRLQSSLPFWSWLYLWNTLNEFPRFLLLNLRSKSLISSDSQRLKEIVFVVLFRTLQEISHRKNNFGGLNWWTRCNSVADIGEGPRDPSLFWAKKTIAERRKAGGASKKRRDPEVPPLYPPLSWI